MLTMVRARQAPGMYMTQDPLFLNRHISFTNERINLYMNNIIACYSTQRVSVLNKVAIMYKGGVIVASASRQYTDLGSSNPYNLLILTIDYS